MARDDQPDDELDYEVNTNQVKDEPIPASRQADQPEQAAQRGEETQRGDAEAHQRRPAPEDRSPALESMSTTDRSSRDRPGDQPGTRPGQPDDDAEPDAENRPG